MTIEEELEMLRRQLYVATQERDFWQGRVNILNAEVRGVQNRCRPVMSRDDKDHYGDREEDFAGASNGSHDWSK